MTIGHANNGEETVARGKYAAKAGRRNEFAEIEQRAVTAEAARDRAEATLAVSREKAEGEITRLKERLADAVAQRDAGMSPLVAEMEGRAEGLRRQLKDAEAAQKEEKKLWRDFADGFHRYLVRVDGLTRLEAIEVMMNCLPGKERATYVAPKHNGHTDISRSDDPRRDLAIGASRGYRHAGDTLSEIFGQLKDDPE